MHSVIFHGPNSSKGSDESGRPGRFSHIEVGHHYFILYPDLRALHRVYSEYVSSEIQEQPNSVVLILPYFDTTGKVREVLEADGIDVRAHERQGLLVIVDIQKVINSSYFELSDVERLEGFTKQIESRYQGKTILVVADMSVFYHLKKSQQLLDYERKLHKDLRVRKWKELCLYNERDFRAMFTEEQVNELLEYHKDRVIAV
jgi:MEDS: MEthanogen/methylotroph, DcmR Sensory domain